MKKIFLLSAALYLLVSLNSLKAPGDAEILIEVDGETYSVPVALQSVLELKNHLKKDSNFKEAHKDNLDNIQLYSMPKKLKIFCANGKRRIAVDTASIVSIGRFFTRP